MRIFMCAFVSLVSSIAFALPDESDFQVNADFPDMTPGGTGFVGCSIPDGRYLVWNGNEVFIQAAVGSGVFNEIASGYIGDPSFVALSFDQTYVLLGQGFGNGVTANAYPFDFSNPQDYQSGDEVVLPSHYSGAFLSSTLLALDRGDFGSPAEIVVVDISGLRSVSAPVAVLDLPEPPADARDTIITKPLGSFSSTITVDGGVVYVTDAGNGQYKSFPAADLITAFNTTSTIPWSNGTDIGTPFQYPMNGVAGVTAIGNLVISGFGAIVEVEPVSGTIVNSIDPAGTGPFYGIIYNDQIEDFIAIEFPPVFGDPLIVYTTEAGVAALPAASFLALGLGATGIVIGVLLLRRRENFA